MVKLHCYESRPRTAMTLVEMMVVVSTFAFIGLFVAFLALEIARHSQTSLNVIPAELDAYRVLDRARTELLSAEYASVRFIDNGNGISFFNPRRGVRLEIRFNPVSGECVFTDPSRDPSGLIIGQNLNEVTFQPTAGDLRRVIVRVVTRTRSFTATGNPNVVTTHSDVITMRN